MLRGSGELFPDALCIITRFACVCVCVCSRVCARVGACVWVGVGVGVWMWECARVRVCWSVWVCGQACALRSYSSTDKCAYAHTSMHLEFAQSHIFHELREGHDRDL